MPLYCSHIGTTDQIYVFPEDTGNGQTPSGSDVRSFNLPPAASDPNALAIEGNNLYVANLASQNNRIVIVAADTADGTTLADSDIIRQFDLPSAINQPQGLALDGDDLYISNASNDIIYIVSASTANGTTATIVRQFNIPSAIFPTALAIDGNDLYIGDASGDRIVIVAADTANNATATIAREFDLPSGNDDPFGITLNGNDLFVSDRIDDNIRVMAADTANNGTATATRTFNLPSGLTDPRGLTFAQSQATITLSTTDTDIRAGDTVTIDIDSTIDITLTDSNITVTGGTRGTLTGSGQDYANYP